jgi:hypothetical protein
LSLSFSLLDSFSIKCVMRNRVAFNPLNLVSRKKPRQKSALVHEPMNPVFCPSVYVGSLSSCPSEYICNHMPFIGSICSLFGAPVRLHVSPVVT